MNGAPPWWRRVAWGTVALASIAAVAVYLVVALLRVGHPFELQWMEGGSVDHVRRVLAGESIYPAPSVEFASYTYPPLYSLVSAGVAWVGGVGFLPLRLVSLASSVGTMAVLAIFVRRRTSQWTAGLVAAGVFAASFRATGAWYDVARVDSLFVFLLILAVAVAASARTWRGALVGGALFALASLTKQTAVFVAAPVSLLLLLRRFRIGLTLLGAWAVPLLVVSLGLSWATGGWYWYETVEVLLGHPVERGAWISFPLRDIGLPLAPALALVACAGAVSLVRRSRSSTAGRKPFTGLEVVAVGGMFAGAWVARLHRGGYDDVLIPAYAGTALLVGLAVGYLRSRRAAAQAAVAAVCLVQLAALAYDPADQVPRSRDVTAGRAFVAAVRAVPGDVLVVSHPWYGVMAGKKPHVQAAAYFDIVRSGNQRARGMVQDSVRAAIAEQRFAAIIFDTDSDERELTDDLPRYYEKIEPPVLRPREPGLWPVTDVKMRPTHWWVPRQPVS